MRRLVAFSLLLWLGCSPTSPLDGGPDADAGTGKSDAGVDGGATDGGLKDAGDGDGGADACASCPPGVFCSPALGCAWVCAGCDAQNPNPRCGEGGTCLDRSPWQYCVRWLPECVEATAPERVELDLLGDRCSSIAGVTQCQFSADLDVATGSLAVVATLRWADGGASVVDAGTTVGVTSASNAWLATRPWCIDGGAVFEPPYREPDCFPHDYLVSVRVSARGADRSFGYYRGGGRLPSPAIVDAVEQTFGDMVPLLRDAGIL